MTIVECFLRFPESGKEIVEYFKGVPTMGELVCVCVRVCVCVCVCVFVSV